ncbi:MAG: MaoC family dehydratase N-terminal domain-containing protein [Candidatus Calescibacterium sp.]|nr:MaoC family dehydratase N-terminal domain-containing protein [Candidatus Calescibacterium sp.]MCX7733599.1 MaoC family dehydratase N-terminal domain-containing protein [bacterium]
MEYSESVKGKEGEWIEEEFCSKDVERFLEAVGYEKDYFLKEKIVPPTFFTVFRKGRPDPEVKGYKTILHAEQEYEIIRLPKFGEKIRYKTKIKDIYQKESSKTKQKMVFVVFETEFYSGNELICIGRSTIVFI